MRATMRAFIRNEAGASAIEYAFVAALIGGSAVAALVALGAQFSARFAVLAAAIR